MVIIILQLLVYNYNCWYTIDYLKISKLPNNGETDYIVAD
ncbi:hypothetical protein NMY3_03398 [Candidatus Nitrosocosmicus oleophilus]|uniref:Uncharacterized protein n=1 Tax=Candidatus Nitrosocosmicus oleophilus TaxID=1353260 RepID=A0A654M4N0_9ARCH|nr:hypothetical protein NMY3_03398 [Candidatus Nitrosocosmicus oleophilus]